MRHKLTMIVVAFSLLSLLISCNKSTGPGHDENLFGVWQGQDDICDSQTFSIAGVIIILTADGKGTWTETGTDVADMTWNTTGSTLTITVGSYATGGSDSFVMRLFYDNGSISLTYSLSQEGTLQLTYICDCGNQSCCDENCMATFVQIPN